MKSLLRVIMIILQAAFLVHLCGSNQKLLGEKLLEAEKVISSSNMISDTEEESDETILIPVWFDHKCGLINSSGEVIVEPIYDYVGYCCDGLLVYKEGDGYGFLDQNGEPYIKAQYDFCQDFHEGLAAVKVDGEYGFINTKGEFVIKPQYSDAFSFSEGLASVTTNDLITEYIRTDGTVAFTTEVARGYDFHEGYASVMNVEGLGTTYGYIDTNGKEVIAPTTVGEMDLPVEDFSDGYGLMRMITDDGNVKYIFMDPDNNILGYEQFDYASSFHEGVAYVEQGEKRGYINTKGEFIYIAKENEDIGWSFNQGLTDIKINGKYGFMNQNFKIVIVPQYDDICEDFEHGYAIVEQDGQKCYINKKGEIFFRMD